MSESEKARKPTVHWAKRLQEESDVEGLLAQVEDPSRGWAAGMAAQALAEMGERRAVKPLYRRLRAIGRGPFEESYEVSDWATLADALGSLEGSGSAWADELLAILKEEDAPVGWYAGSILAGMGDRRAIEPIIESLAAADASDEAQYLKWETEVVGSAVRRLEDELSDRNAARCSEVRAARVLDCPPRGLEHLVDFDAGPVLGGEVRLHRHTLGRFRDRAGAIDRTIVLPDPSIPRVRSPASGLKKAFGERCPMKFGQSGLPSAC